MRGIIRPENWDENRRVKSGCCEGSSLPRYYKNKNWLQFLFIVKADVLIQQISKFYSQIQRTEASDHIYFSQRPVINLKAIFCAYNLRIS